MAETRCPTCGGRVEPCPPQSNGIRYWCSTERAEALEELKGTFAFALLADSSLSNAVRERVMLRLEDAIRKKRPKEAE